MDMEGYRKELDKIDAELIDVLARRFKVINKLALYKKQHNIPTVQKQRMDAILNKARELAVEKNLDPGFVQSLFKKIIEEAIKREEEN